MSLTEQLNGLLEPLTVGGAWPDVPPDAYGDESARPALYIVFQIIGGRAIDFTERALPDHDHARVQVYVWGNRRLEVEAAARTVRETLIASTTLKVETYGAPTWLYEEMLKLRGSRQDFGIWYPP